jgi:hypothetical protein
MPLVGLASLSVDLLIQYYDNVIVTDSLRHVAISFVVFLIQAKFGEGRVAVDLGVCGMGRKLAIWPVPP